MAFPDRSPLRGRSLGFLLAPLFVVLVGVQAGTETSERPREAVHEAFSRPGVAIPIAAHDGRASFSLPSTGPGSQSLVIVSSLSRLPGPYPIQLRASQTAAPSRSDGALLPSVGTPRLRAYNGEPAKEPPAGQPALERAFHLMVREGDVASVSNYVQVRGVLRALGMRVQVYVAAEDAGLVAPDLLKDIVSTFDDRIFPVASGSTGLAHDIDGDGRFTVLLSGWLSRLGNGRHAVDGFVRVTDMDPVFSPPFGNHCDMMYLSTALKAGPHLRTVMAHEYMHAVVFSGKSRQSTATGTSLVGLEEEGWLDEAIAHLAEDAHGFSRTNIDYRVSAFLSQPERYQLVVEDYYAADLFRSHGNRGSTYLFLRWCVDQYGPDLVPTLIQSRLRGTANLESATGCSFTELYRRWSIALFLSGLDPELPKSGLTGFRTEDLRTPRDDWELAGPRASRVILNGPADCWAAAGTSSHFAVIDVPSTGGVEVSIAAPAGAELQITAVPLPVGMGLLELAATASASSSGELRLRAEVREGSGQPVRLTALAWEPLVPPADPRLLEARHGRLDMLGISSNFGTSALGGKGSLSSRSIRMEGVHRESGPIVVKLIGADAKGRRVTAWADVNASRDPAGEGHGAPVEGQHGVAPGGQ